jgi:toxin ParE1/3/4
VKRVDRSNRSEQDTNNAFLYYLDQSAALAIRFVDELEAAFTHIGKHPGMGSPRYRSELAIAGLRFWQFHRFPYSIFYIEHDDHIEVIRVLHQSSDILSKFHEPV